MRKHATRVRMLAVFAPLFVSSALFAQPPSDTTTTSFLDFGQFSTIAPADRLSFLDQLKWAGMMFVNAPAAKRVVSLYEYSSDTIASAGCSDDRLRDYRALVVTRLVPADSVIAALEYSRADQSATGSAENSSIEELMRQLSGPQVNPWITESMLQNLLRDNPSLTNEDLVPTPVWGEISFSNSCELQQMVANLDHDAITWHLVDNPKLLSFIQSASDQATPAKIIATNSFFPEHTEMTQYFAECVPANQRPHVGRSYCDAVR